jgi:sugar phosphate isomerase/epimerase
MKIALAIAPHDAQPSAFVVFRDRLEVSIEKASRMGYDAIELALAKASDADGAAIRRILDDNGMDISAVSTGRVFAEEKAWLTNPDEAESRRAVDILKGLVELAASIGAGLVNVGRARGFVHEGETREAARARFVDRIRECADHGARHGVTIVIEPVNRYEINFINSVVPDGTDVIGGVAHPNVKLMPDVFHMNIEDASIAASLEKAGELVGYVHLADSNRWAPGQGHTDFDAILASLRKIGYDRPDTFVGVEILPYPSPDEAAQQAIAYLRPLIPRAG